jgi:hypothetical protein
MLPGSFLLLMSFISTHRRGISKEKLGEILSGGFADPAGSAKWAPSESLLQWLYSHLSKEKPLY